VSLSTTNTVTTGFVRSPPIAVATAFKAFALQPGARLLKLMVFLIIAPVFTFVPLFKVNERRAFFGILVAISISPPYVIFSLAQDNRIIPLVQGFCNTHIYKYAM